MSQTDAGQQVPLLLVTTAALVSEEVQPIAHIWDGKRVAIASPADSPAAKRSLLEAGWIVVDHLVDGARSTAALCAVMERIAKPIGTPRGPFLYVSDGATDISATLEELGDPRAVVREVDDQGDLALLGLGRDLTSHPLFWDFFDVASDTEMDSEMFLTLLRASLAGEEA